ncbi:hypothetical protein CYMTET_42183 [Cymbomonas tetramitiformis]|uniref:Uncharacterized protein n=1 Tax=Cymbomonas tetramitiformis TaxID=36881 RepID=A0AAE0F2U5_9CHLO|nr:hypothetical protein CYMTET_42183 [Cymbomonas tetramitiformis]
MLGDPTHLWGHSEPIWAVTFSPDNRILATGSQDTAVCLWDVKTGECVATLKGHEHGIFSLCFSPDGQYLASASQDKTSRIWSMLTNEEPRILDGKHLCFV